jgi:2-polyprenyl-3-methyl-5-hydroxy-6-metoxy-1,4-benzoquinol methylase
LHLVDLGCGGGDILLLIEKWATNRGLSIELTGVDANANIIRYAEARTLHKPTIRYVVENIFSLEFASRKFDLVNATLFCHHFTTEELIALLSQLKNQTRIAIVINDLHRHPFAYYSIAWLTRFFSKSYMVKHDAKLSVLRGFSKKELLSIIAKSGFMKYSIKWKWAFRWEIVLYC